MKKDILADIITFFFVFLFLYTGMAKLTEIHSIKEQMIASPLLGSPILTTVITWALPIGEILLAIVLLIPKTRLKALYATCALMTIFTIYVLALFFINSYLSCSCGGIIEQLTPKQHIVFNSACVILSTVAIAIMRRQAPTQKFVWITRSSTICLLLLVAALVATSFTRPVAVKTGMEGKPVPSFDLVLVDSVTRLNTSQIPEGKPFVIIGFAPFCRHCQDETQDIIAHIQQFKDIDIYYVSAEPLQDMNLFYKHFHLKKYPNVIMGRDTKEVFFTYYKASATPYTAVYDRQKRLKAAFTGQVHAEYLAKMAAD